MLVVLLKIPLALAGTLLDESIRQKIAVVDGNKLERFVRPDDVDRVFTFRAEG